MSSENVVRITQKSQFERLTGLPDSVYYGDKEWSRFEYPVGHEVAAEFAAMETES
jgi:hypothetical protein